MSAGRSGFQSEHLSVRVRNSSIENLQAHLAMPKSFATFPSLSIRIDLAEGRIGPGKIRLLEAIRDCGSLAAAGRSMGMTFRRAQGLVKEIESIYTAPAVQCHAGGRGGTTLTPFGLSLVASYREIERQAQSVSRDELLALQTEIAESQDFTEKAS
jgi:molybdate transport system regulatory protein